MSVVINFDQAFPNNFRTHTETLIRKYELLFPLWLTELNISWQTSEGTWASMALRDDYRRANLGIHQQLLSKSFRFQEESIVHEILHCFNYPLWQAADAMLDRFLPEGSKSDDPMAKELYSVLETQLQEILEKINCDFTYSLMRYTDSLTTPTK
jgi:hypothetical protein